MMFEKIHKIDWNKYSHACGPATDMPDWLERLYSNSMGYDVWPEFENCIFHQSNFYSATPVVIPFVIDLMGYSVFKEDCLNLLWEIAWYTNCDTSEADILLIALSEDKEYQKSQRDHNKYRELSQKAVFKGKDTYLELLNDPDDKFYPMLLALISLCEDTNGTISRRIETHFHQSRNEAERATCLYSFGLLDFENYLPLIEKSITHGSKIEQYIGLLITIEQYKRKAPLELYTRILEFKSEDYDPERFDRMYGSVPFTIGMDAEISRCFSCLPIDQREPFIEMLLQERNHFIFDFNLPWLMSLTFGDIQILPPLESLSDIQLKVLVVVARRIWPDGQGVNNQLILLLKGFVKKYGFPENAEAMVKYFDNKFV